jgi:hypothetical protein
VQDQEVGRWICEKCRKPIVAAGQRAQAFHGIGTFTGSCPWECGAWINRGFRWIRPGKVTAYRAEDWDSRALSP